MEIDRIRVYGTPHIGVYIFVNNQIAIIPPGIEEHVKKVISKILGVDIIETKIAGSVLNGVLLTGNDNGIIVPRNILDEEYEVLSKFLKKYDINLYISRSRNTALGNLFLINNKAGIVGHEFEKEEIYRVLDVLGIEIVERNILNLSIPGSLAVVTDKGGVIHPDLSDDELSELKSILKINIERATVNSGIPFIKSGLIANNKGVLVGENTTGPEMLRIFRGFTE